MKKKIAIILSVIMLLICCNTVIAADQSEVEGDINFDIGEQIFKFVRYDIGTDYEGNLAIVLLFDYTNKSKTPNMAASDFYIEVFQNGISKEECILDLEGEWSEQIHNLTTNIKDGVTLSICRAFLLDDTTSSVDVNVKELVNFDETQDLKIDISKFSEEIPEIDDVTDWESKYNDLLEEYEDLSEKYETLKSEYQTLKEKTCSNSLDESVSEKSNEIEKTSDEEVTMGQKNALSKAKSYLNLTAFSYEALIEQLEYAKFSHEEAVYAANNCGADWNEQAVKKAESYLNLTSFSRDGLIEQLEYSGFTHEQAVYGAEANGY